MIEKQEKHTIGLGHKQIFEIDKTSIDDIVDRILVPYLSQKQFYLQGHALKHEDIRRILVKRSDKTAKELADEKNCTDIPNPILRSLTLQHNAQDMIRYKEYAEDITVEARQMALNRLQEYPYHSLKHQTIGNTIVNIDNMTTFNQQNQQVKSQNNAGRDILIGNEKISISSKEDFLIEIKKLRGEIQEAADSELIDPDIADNINIKLSSIIRETKKSEPEKSFITKNFEKTQELLKNVAPPLTFVSTLANLYVAAKKIFDF